jgi:hypothetical protein
MFQGMKVTSYFHFSSLPNIIRVIKSRRVRWMGHVAHMGELNAYNISVEKLERKRPL